MAAINLFLKNSRPVLKNMNNNKNNYKYCKKTNFAKQITCFTFSFATGIYIVDDAMSESRMIPFVPDNFTTNSASISGVMNKFNSMLFPSIMQMNRNARKPKRANGGNRPCSSVNRRKRRGRIKVKNGKIVR